MHNSRVVPGWVFMMLLEGAAVAKSPLFLTLLSRSSMVGCHSWDHASSVILLAGMGRCVFIFPMVLRVTIPLSVVVGKRKDFSVVSFAFFPIGHLLVVFLL